MEGERFAFLVEWYDSLAVIVRRYNFLFYPKDNSVEMYHLDKSTAEEFLEVYRGVVAEYPEMVSELCSGACVAMALTHQHGDACVEQFRQFVGPADPEIARHLRPSTLRAKYGHNKLKNAVHCTDLADDGMQEVEYFFKILR
ncbi:nucleoside diphosphate kinase homolog 7-like isoform X2 [Sycon ciliatum]|uniref:nucleoside diphosphate kinase homolog 7-like isoform X2 n=1 Tax=Sycon ciliatum TaxID=27933 RepID=UPI0031F60F19